MPDWREEDEKEVLRAAQNGDVQAFGQLYEWHAERIFRYLFSHLDNRLDAEDLTEEVFLRTWQALGRYRQRESPFQAFLFRIAHNALMDHYRQQRRRRPPISLDDHRLHERLSDQTQSLEAHETRGQLRHVLGQLSRDYRKVLDLRFMAGLSPEETAQVFGRSVGAIRVLQHRALQALRKLIEEQE